MKFCEPQIIGKRTRYERKWWQLWKPKYWHEQEAWYYGTVIDCEGVELSKLIPEIRGYLRRQFDDELYTRSIVYEPEEWIEESGVITEEAWNRLAK